MTLEFTLTEDDIVDFNVFHLLNDPKIKRRETMRRIFVSGFTLFLYAAFSMKNFKFNPLYPVYYLPLAAVAVFIFLYYHKIYRFTVHRRVKKILKANPGRGITGKYVIKTGKTGFEITTEGGGNKYKNSEIVSVYQTETFIYLYRDKNIAIAVPKNIFDKKNSEKEFLALFGK